MKSNIKVSIICWTYNQEKHISEALESFLMQETNFPFEIIVHDDASTDSTPEIIRNFKRNHPGLIRPIYRKKNMFSSGLGKFINDTFEMAKGEYIALCEGDDYWTDPHKLQKQVDLMDSNIKYALCFHPGKIIFENGEEPPSLYPDPSEGTEFTLERLLKVNFILTNTVMYRNIGFKNVPGKIMPRDWYIHLYHAQYGKIGFLNDVMSAYRRHEGGAWWGAYKSRRKFVENYGERHLELYMELLKIYGTNKKYRHIIYDNVIHMFNSIIEEDASPDRQLTKRTIREFPDFAYKLLMEKLDTTERLEITATENQLKINSLQKDIYTMRSSVSWKITRPFRVISRLISRVR